MPETTLSSLPPEITELIAAHLDTRELSQCIRVCHAWHSAFESFLWRSVKIYSRFQFDSSPSYLESLLRNRRHIRHLTTYNMTLVHHLAFCQSEFDHLQSLDLHLFDDDAMPSFSTPGLLEPPLILGNVNAIMRILTGCPNLLTLSLGGWDCIKHADKTDAFQEIIFTCPTGSLKSLTVTLAMDDGYCCKDSAWSPTFKRDQDEDYQSTIEQQKNFLPFIALQEVCMKGSAYHNNPSKLAILARCPNLVKLELQSLDECVLRLLPDTLQAFCPSVVDLVWTSDDDHKDEHTAAVLRSSRLGWRVLTAPCHDSFGPFSYDAVMKSAETLEQLNMVTWGDGSSEARRGFFLDLFCIARNLQRLNGHENAQRSIHRTAVEVHVMNAFMQHTEGGRDRTWALGPSMKYLEMQVVGVPRPDVICRDNGTPLKPWMVDELDDSRRYEVQRWFYEQLGRMTGLDELVLGMVDISLEDVGDYMPETDVDDEGVFLTELEDGMEEDGWLNRLINYQSLEFSMESGLKLLEGLKELRVLHIKSTAHRIGVAELEWMHVNWPKLKEIKGLITARRWAGDAEDGLAIKTAVEEWMAAHPRGIGSSYY